MGATTKHITARAMDEMEKRFRVRFVNSLPGFKSLNLIGTINESGESNLSIVSTVTHLGSNPPLIGYISRPEAPERHTLTNILDTGNYTVNQISESHYEQAHQTSARYPREISEFEAVGLSPIRRDGLDAPFVKESQVAMHLTLIEKVDIESNGTVLVIGKVTDVFLSESLLERDGNIDLEKAGTIAGSGLDGYYRPEKLARLAYAKSDQPVRKLGGEESE